MKAKNLAMLRHYLCAQKKQNEKVYKFAAQILAADIVADQVVAIHIRSVLILWLLRILRAKLLEKIFWKGFQLL